MHMDQGLLVFKNNSKTIENTQKNIDGASLNDLQIETIFSNK